MTYKSGNMKQAHVQRCRSGWLVPYAVGLTLFLCFGGYATKTAVLGERSGGSVYHHVAFSPDGRFLATSRARGGLWSAPADESIVFDIGSRGE